MSLLILVAPVHMNLHSVQMHLPLFAMLTSFTAFIPQAVDLAAIIAAVHAHAVTAPAAAAIAHMATSSTIVLSKGHIFSLFSSEKFNNHHAHKASLIMSALATHLIQSHSFM